MPPSPHKGRGAASAPQGRFAVQQTELDADEDDRRLSVAPETVIKAMPAGKIISRNDSPDIPFAQLLDKWQKPAYVCKAITIGANTDPYQPAEKSLGITRQLLQQFAEYRHPVNLITKSHLVVRDIDLLADLAKDRLCSVAISIPTMNPDLKRVMEPRVPSSNARLKAARRLSDAGVPVSVLVAPIIPAINDDEIEAILDAAASAGITQARYIFLRLPHELKSLFDEWLNHHFPDRAAHVMSLVRQASGGKTYDARFGRRQTGRGPYAEMLAARFRKAAKALQLDPGSYQQRLDCTRFLHPARRQLGLDV